MKKVSEDQIISFIHSLGYSLGSNWKCPANNKDRFEIICNDHGSFYTYWNNISNGRRCPKCSRLRSAEKRSLCKSKLKKLVESKFSGYSVENIKNYKNIKSTILIKCEKGHLFSSKVLYFYEKNKNRGRCTVCSSTANKIKKYIENNSLYSIKDCKNTIKSHEKICIKCKIHGYFSITWANLKLGHGCPGCGRNSQLNKIKLSLNEIKNRLIKNDLVFMDMFYKNNYKYIKFRCKKKGHICTRSMYNLFKNFNCTPCSTKISSCHRDIVKFIKQIYSKDIIINNRTAIYPLELDIWIPEYKIGIEIDGLYWHSNKHRSNMSVKNIHKSEELDKRKIELLAIFEDEWVEKNELIKSIISDRLRINNKINIDISNLYFRKLNKNSDFCEFFDKNHLYGNKRSSFAYGLYLEDKMISCASFRKNTYYNEWELVRFSDNYKYKINGSIGFFIEKFMEEYSKDLVYYANNRLFCGNIYKDLCFVNTLINRKPCFWYTDFKKRSLTKNNIDMAYKVYDYGYKKLIIKK